MEVIACRAPPGGVGHRCVTALPSPSIRTRALPQTEKPTARLSGVRNEAAAERGVGPRAFRLGVAGCAGAVAVFLLVQLSARPPQEDETLALFVGRNSVGGLFDIVLGERGGAPLHFVVAWAVAHLGGGLLALRLCSALFAVASIPVVAALVARLTDRTVALAATALVSGSWVLLLQGVNGRMYSLFLCTSALSYLALLAALERGGGGRFALWALAILATIATHPYGALVLASQGVYILLVRTRVREAVLAFGAVAVAGIPFWRTDLVLAGRFDVGVGGGGKLGGPWAVLEYLWRVAGDFSAGYPAALGPELAVAAFGAWTLARARRSSALLAAAVFLTPALALLLVSLGNSHPRESRHLIFALPLFGMLVAAGLVEIARRRPRLGPAVALAGAAVLLSTEVAWAWHKTPRLFTGEPRVRVEAREAAAAWLTQTGRPDDVLFGYDPLFLGAWERSRTGPRTVVPRADARLALRALEAARKPLGRGVWVFDASDTNNFVRRLTIPLRLPRPHTAFEGVVFGPFLIIRTREPTRVPREYLRLAARTMRVGQSLLIGDADINLQTVERAAARLDRESVRPLTTSAR